MRLVNLSGVSNVEYDFTFKLIILEMLLKANKTIMWTILYFQRIF